MPTSHIKKLITIIVLGMSLWLSGTAFADQWEQYIQYLERFYFLDKQPFNSFSCRVVLPEINESIERLREKTSEDGKRYIVNENIAEFRVEYNHNKGLYFKTPSVIISHESAENERVRKGLEMINMGLNTQVFGATVMLKGLFSQYFLPDSKGYTLREVQVQDDSAKVVYVRSGIECTDEYAGLTGKSVMTGPSSSMESNIQFRKVGEKLLYDSLSQVMVQEDSTVTSEFKIHYQQVGPIYLPSKISGTTTSDRKNSSSEVQIEILLENCLVQ